MKIARNIITVNLLKIYFFLLPFQFTQNSIFYIPFRLIPLLIILFESNYLINLVRINPKRYFYIISFFITSAFLAIGTKYYFLPIKGSFFYLANFGLLMPILINTLKDKKSQIDTFSAFSIGVFLSSLCILNFFIDFIDIPKNFIEYNLTGGALNPRLGLGGVNDYSLVVLIHLLWLLHLRNELKLSKINSRKNLFFLLLDFLLIVIAGSRVALFSALCCLSFNSLKLIKRKFLIIVLIISTTFLLNQFLLEREGLFGNRLLSTFEISSRLSVLSDVQDIRPIGLGIGTSRYNDYFGLISKIDDWSLHNSFVILFYETGYLIAPLFYFYLFSIIRLENRKRKLIIFLFFINISVITHIYQDIFVIFLSIGLINIEENYLKPDLSNLKNNWQKS